MKKLRKINVERDREIQCQRLLYSKPAAYFSKVFKRFLPVIIGVGTSVMHAVVPQSAVAHEVYGKNDISINTPNISRRGAL